MWGGHGGVSCKKKVLLLKGMGLGRSKRDLGGV